MSAPLSEPALALTLLQEATRRGMLVAILRSAGRLERVGSLAQAFADGVEVLLLPPWDVLPYDRALPGAATVGRRVRSLTALARPPAGPRLLLTSASAALQRVRPPTAWAGAELALRQGDGLDEERLRSALAERGYRWDERVDEPGEVALRGQVIDVFPAGDIAPARLELEQGRIAAIRRYDLATLRSTEALDEVVLGPAIEFPLDPDGLDEAAEALAEPDEDGEVKPAELKLPNRLSPLFDYVPDAAVYRDPEVSERWVATREAVEDAYAAAGKAVRVAGQAGVLPRQGRLYLSVKQAEDAAGPGIALPDEGFREMPAPRRIDELIAAAREAEGAVVIATPADPGRVAASLARRGLEARVATCWAEAMAGGSAVLAADPATGLAGPGLTLLPIGPLLRPRASATLATADEAPRVGEVVVHLDHGVCRLSGLRELEDEDRIALEFAEGSELLIPADELDRVWRYGGEGGTTLDRISGAAWTLKRQEVEVEVARTAYGLAQAATARAAASAPVIKPPADSYAQVARGFPYPPSPDQRAAIRDVQDDLASGHPMDRRLCGDVGFGKTEIAIRAAAAAALSGHQVAVAAPTTVLARQHLDVFRRRFAGTGIRVEGLVRGAAAPESRATRAAVEDGTVGIVVGTQGLAQLRFAKLGLAIIDEEQRFGEGDKSRLGKLAQHVLAMTATPIPRTLQAALVGLRDVSVLATPPQNRQPTRTFVLPWDPVVVREALLRESRRGGQSFIVCPRIAGIAPMQARLAELVPELTVVAAHGRMKPEALEDAVLGFAAGRGDVLLATNIIEAGLDIPRANLMLVTEADRFGLAQLHQLRGRVGRSARRGTAYLLTEPGRRLTVGTRRRLAAMETMAGLGAGVAISAADLDLRGAGDLFGAEQAGHLRAIGTELYQHLLAEAVAAQRGEKPAPPSPALYTGLTGRIPASYVPEENLRIGLLRRLARLPDEAALDEFSEELADRFGPPPPDTAGLLHQQRLRILCRTLGVARVDAGPQAIAVSPVDGAALERLAAALGGTVKDRRIVLPLPLADPARRVAALTELLSAG